MITDEIFLVKSTRETRYYESRRALARAALEGYLDSKTKREAPIVVRFQRGPARVANSDIGDGIREYLKELPNFIASNINDRSDLTDAMEAKIGELL